MIKYIVALLGLLIIAFILYECYQFRKGKKELINTFTNGNVIVYGLKGHGKDLIFNKVINARNKHCYANIQYNKILCEKRDIKDFSVSPNTFENVLENNVKIVKKTNEEETDFYISDGGIFLPSQYSNTLIKKYPSLPIYYALSRHLTNSNIHINTQYLGRVWDKLREQASYYIWAESTKRIGKYLITYFTIYDNYDTAMAKEKKIKSSALLTRAETRAKIEEQESKAGLIKELKIIQKISDCKYDTRQFHEIFYNIKANNNTD